MEVEQLLERLRGVLQGGPALRLAVIFGSAASDRLRPDSDVDIGIVPADPELTLRDELDLQARLERALGRPVDLVRLDRATTLLRWEVARSGIPVLSDSPGTFARFRAEAAIERADMLPNLEDARARLQARLARVGQP